MSLIDPETGYSTPHTSSPTTCCIFSDLTITGTKNYHHLPVLSHTKFFPRLVIHHDVVKTD